MMKKLILVLIAICATSCQIEVHDILTPPVSPPKTTGKKIFFIGDSMSSDDPGNISMTGTSVAKSYGWYLKQLFKDSNNYTFRNHAISGVGIAQMYQQMQTILTEKDSTKKNIVIILGCINNISFNSMSGTECYTQIASLHSQLKAKGFTTIGINLTSRRQLAYFTEQQSLYFWGQIQEANNLFGSNIFSDKFVNLQSDLLRDSAGIKIGFSGYEAATESSYFSDGCHFSELGKKEIANKLKPLL